MLDVVDLHRSMSLGVYPDEWILPAVCKFYSHRVVALGASGPSCFEDRVWALAIAVYSFEY